MGTAISNINYNTSSSAQRLWTLPWVNVVSVWRASSLILIDVHVPFPDTFSNWWNVMWVVRKSSFRIISLRVHRYQPYCFNNLLQEWLLVICALNVIYLRSASPSTLHRYAIWQFSRTVGKPFGHSWGLLSQPCPDLHNTSPLSRQHAVLEAVETLPMDRRQKLASD